MSSIVSEYGNNNWIVGRQSPFLPENLLVPLINLFVSLNVTLEETSRFFRDVWFCEFYLVDFVEVIASVHFPAPIVKEADVEGVGRAEERTSHAHKTVMMEFYCAGFVSVNVFCRAALDA